MKTIQFLLVPVKIFFWLLLYSLFADISGGINTDFGQLYFEVPLVILTATLLYFATRPTLRFRSLAALSPILIYYLFMDAYYAKFGRVFKWVEVTDLNLLLDVMPWFGVLLLLAILLLSLYWVQSHFHWQHWPKVLLSFTPIYLLVASVFATPSLFSTNVEHYSRKIYIDEKNTTAQNGRLITPLYFEAKRRVAREKMVYDPQWAKADSDQNALALKNQKPRNIHIIVMESWIDPTLFTSFQEAEAILPEFFQQAQQHRNFSISPVFGGQTPQAEFEILCGIPAMQRLGTIEFNFFSGNETSCLPNWLAKAGWTTMASHAHKPTFFNRINAYESLGFNEVYFPADYSADAATYLTNGLLKNETYMFDGDFLNANLEFIKTRIDEGKPLLNYVLGVYGHWPNQLTEARFPPKFSLDSTIANSQVNQVINQFYYRTIALADYLVSLQKIDPDSFILVVSDHLPPIPGDSDWREHLGYFPQEKQGDYINIFYAWDGLNPVKLPETIHHYDMVRLILDRVAGMCPHDVCVEDKTERYNKVISSAIH